MLMEPSGNAEFQSFSLNCCHLWLTCQSHVLWLTVSLVHPGFSLSRFPLPDVVPPLPGAFAAVVTRIRRDVSHLQRHRPDDGRAAGVRQLPTWHVPALALHVDGEERVRAVPPGLVHGAVELHRKVSPLRGVWPEPGGEDRVRRGQRLPVRVQAGVLLQGAGRPVSAPQPVPAGTGSAEQR